MPSTALSGAALVGVSRAGTRTTGAERGPAPEAVAPAVPESPTQAIPVPTAPRQEPVVPQPVPVPGPDEPDESDLPWLSRLMETMSIPVPARPSEVEVRDDRARGSR
jgi:hypothetical protein